MERFNTFQEYADHKKAEDENPDAVDFFHVDSNYQFLMQKMTEVNKERDRIVEGLYDSRKFNRRVNEQLTKEQEELEKWQDMLRVAQDIQDTNQALRSYTDPEITAFIERANTYIEHHTKETKDLLDATQQNQDDADKKSQPQVIMNKIHEDAIKEDSDWKNSHPSTE